MLPSTPQPVSNAGMNTAEAEKYSPRKQELRKQSSYRSCESSTVRCPGKAAARRLQQFEDCWIARSARSINTNTNDEIMEIQNADLLVNRILGHGGFSTVTRVYIRNPTTGHFDSEQSYAMKKLRVSKTLDLSSIATAASDLGLETKILKNLSHENIIKLRGVKAGDMIESLKLGSFFIILDELVETLKDRLERWRTMTKKLFYRRHSTASTNRRLRDVAVGIANGMAYLHSKNIMFRDLKPANIGFDVKGKVKIFDFGLAREYNVNAEGRNTVKPRRMTGLTGTLRYMAPEVARMGESYGFPADVHSFAVLLWQIVTNRVPFAKVKSPRAFEAKVFNGNFRPNLKRVDSDNLRRIIATGWSPQPDLRPTFAWIAKALRNIIETRPSGVGSDPASTLATNKQLKRRIRIESVSKVMVRHLMACAGLDRYPAQGHEKTVESQRPTFNAVHGHSPKNLSHRRRQPSMPVTDSPSDSKRSSRTEALLPTMVVTVKKRGKKLRGKAEQILLTPSPRRR